MRTNRLWLFVLIAGVLALPLLACQAAPAPAPTPTPAPKAVPAPTKPAAAAPAKPAEKPKEVQQYLFGTTPVVSSHYPYLVAASRLISRVVPEVNLTPVETGGSVDNIKRIGKGEFKISLTAHDTLYPAYHGLDAWKDNPVNNVRVLWSYGGSPITYVVREDSGIKSLYELTGKDYNPSGKGTASEKITEQAFEVLGIKPKYYRGGVEDAVAAVKDKRIVGYTKVALGRAPDATTLEIMVTTPIRVLGFTKEDIEKVIAKYPYFGVYPIPAGTYKYDWNKEPILTFGVIVAVGATTEIPEELAYKMVKAIWDNKADLVPTWPDFKDIEPKFTLESANTPLHAGAVKYYREIGLKVPEELLPPEMKR